MPKARINGEVTSTAMPAFPSQHSSISVACKARERLIQKVSGVLMMSLSLLLSLLFVVVVVVEVRLDLRNARDVHRPNTVSVV